MKRVQVLIVDDSKELQDTLVEILTTRFTESIDIFRSSNGLEALEFLKKGDNIEVLITDENMPKMTGIELISHLEKEKIKFRKIFLISALDEITVLVDKAPNAHVISKMNIVDTLLPEMDLLLN